MTEARSTTQRKADALAVLERGGHAWLSTASQGRPHVIGVSAWWDGALLTVATRDGTVTARNLDAGGGARVAFGTPDDAVVIDTRLEASFPAASAPPEVANGFEAAMGWNPAEVGPGWRYFRLRLRRVEVFRGYDETPGRDVMKEGGWLA